MRVRRYRGRHLRPRRKGKGVAVGAATVVLSAPASGAAAGEYVVRPGDTLSGIADRLGTSVPKLARLNRLKNPNHIIAGTSLRTSGVGRAAGGGSIYKIRPGDTLSAIASRFGTSVSALARQNNLSDPNMIVAGAKLRIGGGGRAARPSTPPPAPTPPAPTSSSIEDSLTRHATSHGVDPALVKAVAYVESGWRQEAVSSAGAIGVMQLLPSTADHVNAALGGHGLDARVADHNIHLGVIYLRHLIDTLGSEERALAGYYTGPGNVGDRLTAAQSWYVSHVMATRARYS